MTTNRTRFILLTTVLAGATGAAAAGLACSSTQGAKSGAAVADSGTLPGADASETADASEAEAPEAGSACLQDDSDPLADCDAISDAGSADAAMSCIYTDDGRFHCIDYHDKVKRGLARKAIDCVVALPSSCGIGGGPAIRCARDLAPQLCPDPTTADFCQPLVTYCADAGAQFGSMLQQQDCESYASMLNSAGRADFMDCIKSDQSPCSMTNLFDCLGRIK
jgi:hypothetical protein